MESAKSTRISFYRIMANQLNLHTLPVELFYRILNYLDDFTIISALSNVCKRVDTMMENYRRYKVNHFRSCKQKSSISTST